jgi:hypothetical protein
VASKQSLVDAIMEINPSASPEWLAGFSEQDLQQYLDHLCTMLAPVDRACWIRPSEQPAAYMRECA